MKPEQQRIAIAEACGTMKWSYALPTKTIACTVPDYLNDLNAMHEAEKICLRPNPGEAHAYEKWETWIKYVGILGDQYTGDDDVAHATASQRAKAFLRTLNLWTDD